MDEAIVTIRRSMTAPYWLIIDPNGKELLSRFKETMDACTVIREVRNEAIARGQMIRVKVG
jgi:hypothetical protein